MTMLVKQAGAYASCAAKVKSNGVYTDAIPFVKKDGVYAIASILLSVSIGSVNAVPEGGLIGFPITLSGGTSDQNIVVNVTYSGTATRNTDYTGPDTVTILAGQTTATLNVQALNDVLAEGEEYITVTISPPENTSLNIGVSSATITDVFTPAWLFANNEQGVWYDPSDVKAYTDSAVLGSELCGNGGFDSSSGWTLQSGWSISGGKLVASSAAATNARYAYAGAGNTLYRLSITTDSVTQSDVTFRLVTAGGGNVTDFNIYWNNLGTRTYYVRTNNQWAYIEVSAGGGAGFSGVIDNVSVKECISFGVEPKLFQDRFGTTPVTADGQTVGLILDKSKGLVLGSEAFSGWSLQDSLWIESPVGTWSINNTSGSSKDLRKSTQFTVGKGYRVTFTASGITGSVSAWIGTGYLVDGVVVTNGTKTFNIVAKDAYLWIRAENNATATISGISVKELSGNHATAPSDAARPLYKTDGTYHWLQFDGVDDMLNTAAINFTATDKMSVFAGLRKNTDANQQVCLELGTGIGAEGTFLWRAPYSSGQSGFTFNLSGSSGSYYLNTGIVAPATRVLSSLMNIGASTLAEELVPRINGVVTQNGSSGTVAGTGNFSNNALYIAARAGNVLPLNGNIYSMIVRGAPSTTQEITDTENWVAAKTGVTL